MSNEYRYVHENGILIVLKGNEVVYSEYIEELDQVEDTICELREEGHIPCDAIVKPRVL